MEKVVVDGLEYLLISKEKLLESFSWDSPEELPNEIFVYFTDDCVYYFFVDPRLKSVVSQDDYYAECDPSTVSLARKLFSS